MMCTPTHPPYDVYPTHPPYDVYPTHPPYDVYPTHPPYDVYPTHPPYDVYPTHPPYDVYPTHPPYDVYPTHPPYDVYPTHPPYDVPYSPCPCPAALWGLCRSNPVFPRPPHIQVLRPCLLYWCLMWDECLSTKWGQCSLQLLANLPSVW